MGKDIDKFVRELADYINKYIVGKENTKIKQCNITKEIKNRGHVIPIELMMPEDIELDDVVHMGPAFYAEELMREFPDSTTACIAEILNARVNEFYQSFIAIAQAQSKASIKALDEYDPKDIILTAVPASQCDKKESEPFLSKNDENLGLTLFLKAKLCEDKKEKQAYFVPIQKKDGEEGTKEQWETAAMNSFAMSHITADIKSVTCSDIPLFGIVTDENRFYDFFYLLNPEEIWDRVKNVFGVERVYIIPNGAYEAVFILDSTEIREDPAAKKLADDLLKKGISDLKGKPLPVFVYDCDTMEITRYKE